MPPTVSWRWVVALVVVAVAAGGCLGGTSPFGRLSGQATLDPGNGILSVSGELGGQSSRPRPRATPQPLWEEVGAESQSYSDAWVQGLAEPVDEWIVRVRPGVPRHEVENLARGLGATVRDLDTRLDAYLFKALPGVAPLTVGRGARDHPRVLQVSPNSRVRAFREPLSEPLYANQKWHYDMVRLPEAWNLETGNVGVRVAILDTRMAPNHEDLPVLVAPHNAVSPRNEAEGQGAISHGTRVAGVVGAVANNGKGVAGTAWSVGLLSVRVLADNGVGDMWDIAKGIRWAADNGAHVINMSFGSCTLNTNVSPSRCMGNSFVDDAIEYAHGKGAVLVAAAGNDGLNRVSYPANHPKVISVGAVRADRQRASYSSYGPDLELVAPGGDGSGPAGSYVWTTDWDGGNGTNLYAGVQGTSFAAPHVSGVIALMIARGAYGPQEIRYLLQQTAMDLGAPGWDAEYGHGLLDAASVLAAAGGPLVVFAAERTGNQLRPRSEIQATTGGNFLLRRAEPGQWSLVGWIDVDGDGRVSPGDYFGEYPGLVNVLGGRTLTGLNFTIGRYASTAPHLDVTQ